MALKIGKIEIGYRLLVSIAGIVIAYGWLGADICTLLRQGNYLLVSLYFLLAIIGVFAIPLSLGGLLAAIASIITVYLQSDLTHSLITATACLVTYLLGFQYVRYEADPEKKLSILEIVATVVTIAFTVAISKIFLQSPINWLISVAIGVIAGAITLIGKQLSYIDLSQNTIWRLFGILSVTSLAIGLASRAILYATTKEIQLY